MTDRLLDSINFDHVAPLLEGFSQLTGFSAAVVDFDGKILLKHGWRKICTDFHRIHPEAAKKCFLSESAVTCGLKDGKEFFCFTCENGLSNAAVPLVIQGKHAANIFAGQFFLEKPDRSFFADQARRYGFDESAYLQALDAVPAVDRETVESAVQILRRVIQPVSETAIQNIELKKLNAELQRSKAALGESEARHHRLFETMTQGIIYQDADGAIISANPAAEGILGLSSAQMQGITSADPLWDMVNEANAPVSGEDHPAMTALRTGNTAGPVIRGIIHPLHHTRVWLKITAVPLFQPGEIRPFQVYSAFEDVTERRETEQALQENRKLLHSVFQSIQEGITVLNPDMTIREVNQTQERRFAHASPLEGRKCFEAFQHRAEPCENCPSVRTFREKTPSSEIVPLMKGKRKDGWVELFSYPIMEQADGEVTGVVEFSRDITARKAAEDEIRRFKTIADTALYGNAIADLEGNLVYVNRFLAEIHGFTPEDLIGRHLFVFHAPEQKAEAAQILADLKQKGNIKPAEVRHAHRDGTQFPMLMSGVIIPDEHGRSAYLAVTAVDLTAYTRARQDYRLLFNKMHSGFALHEIICDDSGVPADYRFLSVNPAFQTMTGLKAEELIGRRVLEVLPDTEQFWIDTYGKVALTGTSVSFEHYSSEIEKHFEVTAFRPGDRQFACTFQDISERKRSEHFTRIRLSLMEYARTHSLEALLQKILDEVESLTGSAVSFYYFVEKDQKHLTLQAWSAGTQNEFCNAPEKGRHFPIDRAGVWADCLRQRQAVIHNDYQALSDCKGLPEGHEKVIRELIVPVFRSGDAAAVLGVGNKAKDYTETDKAVVTYLADITWEIIEHKRADEELKETQNRLVQMQKLETVGRLAGGIAHDFNNMLGVILGRAEMGLEQVKSNLALHEDLLEIRKAAERSAELTAQLLAFARKQEISPELVDLNADITDMLTMIQRLIGEDITLDWKPTHDLWSVRIDTSQLHQILVNLCVNAREAISGVGTITIETENTVMEHALCAQQDQLVPGEYVLLSVTDDGCGIDEHVLPHIFDPFYTTREVGRGTGMGLATVHGIVKQNRGCIHVSSEPGRGTAMKIYFPRQGEQIQRQDDAASFGEREQRSGTVLVVDDNPAILRMTEKLLEKLGCSVLTAETPRKAVRTAEEHRSPIDLLLTDVVMPEMNGRDLGERIRRIHPGTRLLFMSGYADNVISRQGVLDGLYSFIQKPFTIQELSEKIQEVFGGG